MSLNKLVAIVAQGPQIAARISEILGPGYQVLTGPLKLNHFPWPRPGLLGESYETVFSPKKSETERFAFLKEKTESLEKVFLFYQPGWANEALCLRLSVSLNLREAQRVLLREISSFEIKRAIVSASPPSLSQARAAEITLALDRLAFGRIEAALKKKGFKNPPCGIYAAAILAVLAEREAEIGLFRPLKRKGLEIKLESPKNLLLEDYRPLSSQESVGRSFKPELGVASQGESRDLIESEKPSNSSSLKVPKERLVKERVPANFKENDEAVSSSFNFEPAVRPKESILKNSPTDKELNQISKSEKVKKGANKGKATNKSPILDFKTLKIASGPNGLKGLKEFKGAKLPENSLIVCEVNEKLNGLKANNYQDLAFSYQEAQEPIESVEKGYFTAKWESELFNGPKNNLARLEALGQESLKVKRVVYIAPPPFYPPLEAKVLFKFALERLGISFYQILELSLYLYRLSLISWPLDFGSRRERGRTEEIELKKDFLDENQIDLKKEPPALTSLTREEWLKKLSLKKSQTLIAKNKRALSSEIKSSKAFSNERSFSNNSESLRKDFPLSERATLLAESNLSLDEEGSNLADPLNLGVGLRECLKTGSSLLDLRKYGEDLKQATANLNSYPTIYPLYENQEILIELKKGRLSSLAKKLYLLIKHLAQANGYRPRAIFLEITFEDNLARNLYTSRVKISSRLEKIKSVLETTKSEDGVLSGQSNELEFKGYRDIQNTGLVDNQAIKEGELETELAAPSDRDRLEAESQVLNLESALKPINNLKDTLFSQEILKKGSVFKILSSKELTIETNYPQGYDEASLVFHLYELGFIEPLKAAMAIEELKAKGLIRSDLRRLKLTSLGRELIQEVKGRFSFFELSFLMALQKRLELVALGQTEPFEHLDLLRSQIELCRLEVSRYLRAYCPIEKSEPRLIADKPSLRPFLSKKVKGN
jgi:DNA topoisomerase IA